MSEEIPHEFLCPITLEMFVDPVVCCDGYTYERKSILKMKSSLSPLTREPINKKRLIPNRNLKNAIDTYKMSHDQRSNEQQSSEQPKSRQSISRHLTKNSSAVILDENEIKEEMQFKELYTQIKNELLQKQKEELSIMQNELLQKQKEELTLMQNELVQKQKEEFIRIENEKRILRSKMYF